MDTNDNDQDRVEAPGWEAIDSALRPIYHDQEPKHYGTIINYRLGGPDPLDGISAYARLDPVPHWHLVTYGFSELYEKETDNRDVSGYGFELTMRLSRTAEESEPPMWVLNFLQNLARYVFKTGNTFASGDHMNLNGPISLDHPTLITAIAFMHDPELQSVVSPNGRVEFLQVVGLTADEYVQALAWNTDRLLELLIRHLPLAVTQIARSSLLDEPSFAQAAAEGSRTDGSSTAVLLLSDLSFQVLKRFLRPALVQVSISANSVPIVARVLPARFAKGVGLRLSSASAVVSLEPGAVPAWSTEGTEKLVVMLPVPSALLFAQELKPQAGEITLPDLPNFLVQVKQVIIRDPQGNPVRTVG